MLSHDKKRARKYAPIFKGILSGESGCSLLDVGLGSGWLAKQIRENYGLSVEGLDVIDTNTANIKLQIYDGLHFPFKDRSFDYSLIFATLHHCDDIPAVLKEASRVSRKGIIIYENLITSKYNKFFELLHDFISNRYKLINCPYNHKSYKDWQNTFNQLGLKICHEQRFSEHKLVFTSHRVLWLLRPY